MATAFVEATRQLYPGDVIDVIIKKELSSIAPMIEGINTIHVFSKQEYPGLGGVFRFGKTLRDERYDIFFNLPASLSSAVMAWATRAKNRVGFTQEGGIFLLTNPYKKPIDVHHVDKYLTILEKFTGKTITDKHVWLNAQKPTDEPHRVLVNFNSEASARRMPLDKGKHIINTLTSTFPKTTFTFIGSPKEKEYVGQLLEGLENADRLENITGTTNLPQLSTIMACSKVGFNHGFRPGAFGKRCWRAQHCAYRRRITRIIPHLTIQRICTLSATANWNVSPADKRNSL